jgi:hypothetical protein
MSAAMALILLAAASGPAPAARASAPTSLSRLPLVERCALARLLGRQLRDVLEWTDRRKLDRAGDHFAGGVLDLAIFESGADDPSRPLVRQGERCEATLPLLFPPPAQLQVRIAAGCPPRLEKPYAVLFGKEQARGRRWEFVWELNTSYTGCDGVIAGGVSRMQVAAPRVRLVVTRAAKEFVTTHAVLELGRWRETVAE